MLLKNYLLKQKYVMNKITGRIIKKKNKKVVVLIKKNYNLKIIKKRIFYYSKIIAYDFYNEVKIGDYVLITKSRPLTKTIFWVISKIIEKIKLI